MVVTLPCSRTAFCSGVVAALVVVSVHFAESFEPSGAGGDAGASAAITSRVDIVTKAHRKASVTVPRRFMTDSFAEVVGFPTFDERLAQSLASSGEAGDRGLELLHHARMVVARRGFDPLPVRLAGAVLGAEAQVRRRRHPVARTLVVGHAEVDVQLAQGLAIALGLEILVRQHVVRERVLRILLDEGPERLDAVDVVGHAPIISAAVPRRSAGRETGQAGLTPPNLPVDSRLSHEVTVTNRRRSRATLTILIAAGAAVLFAVLPGAGAADAPALKVILEVDRDAYYAGDPVPVRLSIWNDSNGLVAAPAGEISSGFELFDIEGKKISPVSVAAAEGEAPAAAGSLKAGAFVGYARDLTIIFPKLKDVGTYRLQWRGGSLESNAVILRVVPRYDPEKDYTARIETDMGTFTIELLRKDAPIAVKTFVDLAQDGFYDGLTFHYVEGDRVIVGGDPAGTGQGGPGFHIPHERTATKMLAGTVILLPSGRPPANGSIFAILLAPRPDYEGNATGFAQVVEGLDAAKRISNVPASSKDAPSPHHRPKTGKILPAVVKAKPAA